MDILQVGRDEEAGYFYYVMELADPIITNQCSVISEPSSLSAATLMKTDHRSLITNYSPRTLRTDFQRHGPLPPAECVALGLKLTAALEHLHQNRLVHRDIKPSNIIFVKGEPKLADIGLVTAIGEAQSLVGTVGYIPPEGPGSAQADLYSLGKLLYEAALGKDRQDFPLLPIDFPSHPDYAALIEINEIILKACETDPRLRYHSARDMYDDLALLQRGQSIKRKRTTQRLWRLVTKVGLAAIAVALAVLAWPLVKGSRAGHAPNPEAVRLYNRGQWYYSQLTPEDHEKALRFLTQAVERDPTFLEPYGELIALYTWNMLPGVSSEVRLERTKAIVAQTMAIDPASAQAHFALSFSHFLERDWPGAESEVVRAIERNPNLAIAHDLYTFYLGTLERFEEAHREAQRAEALEPPGSARVTAIVGAFPYIGERRFDGAIAQLQRGMELDKRFANGHFYLWLCHEAQSNYVAAIDEFKQAGLIFGLDAAQVTAACDALRQAYDTVGEKGYLQKWIELVEAEASLPQEKRVFGDAADCDLAGHYARLGEKEKALKELEDHFDEPNVWQQVKFLPLHDSLRGEPRFQALVKEAGLSP